VTELLRQHERLIIVRTLQACGLSRTRTALALQLSRTQLWRRMRDLHLDLQALPVVLPGRPRKEP
jgi:DNA-binding NtrC family response regulator